MNMRSPLSRRSAGLTGAGRPRRAAWWNRRLTRAGAVLTAVVTAVALAAPAKAAYPLPGRVTGDVRTHDPSMVRTPSGYLLHATHDGVQTRTSPDRIAF